MSNAPAAPATRFHHVGFVVASIEDSIGPFQASIGAARRSEITLDPIQSVKVAFLIQDQADAPQIELVEPVGQKSPVRRFLERGGGLHHVCYETADIEAQLKYMQTQGATLIRRPRPAAAFQGRQIAWVMTREKLLVEYLERFRAGETI